MYNPISTYRLQFNSAFTLRDMDAVIPYFEALGVKTIYASPVFKAVPGSNHGYDSVDPHTINPEIGTEAELRAVIKKLQDAGIGWIQDIVPNHMAFHPTNGWLMNVLEKGKNSPYVRYFDIAGATDFFSDPVMIPFLGSSLDEIIVNKELEIIYSDGGLSVKYGEQIYPLNAVAYVSVLESAGLEKDKAVNSLLGRFQKSTENTKTTEAAWNTRKNQFANIYKDTRTGKKIKAAIKSINADSEKLKDLLNKQYYRLCDWKETDKKINFRRFFTVNGLICLNMQDEKVFDDYHKKIKDFVDEGLFNGIRVDHIDGLYDPATYMQRLRKLCGDDIYILVEKILEPGEKLDSSWPIQGTTGYNFLALVSNLFTRNSAENKFSKFYRSLTKDSKSVHERIVDKKAAILSDYMGGECENLHRYFISKKLIKNKSEAEDPSMKDAIGTFIIHCPVYRYYGNKLPLSDTEYQDLKEVFDACRKHKPELKPALDILEDVLVNQSQKGDETYRQKVLDFYQRCMQFTGPLMAKGVEDTLMYTFNRFLGHNEVGDSPEFFGLTTADFHRLMQERQEYWPLAMNATSTHDTKRGEDARMRLDILPDLAKEWIEKVTEWIEINEKHKTKGAPDANDEYFIYQTLIGSFPMQEEDDYLTRLEAYFTKAFREAKRHTDWADPDESHEKAVLTFVKKILSPKSDFLKSFIPFQKKVTDYGIIQSLGQLILKFTCPGVPDNYQGTTTWDLSLVDPDNRRMVDYAERQESLKEVSKPTDIETHSAELWNSRANSRIKLWLAQQMFQLRKTYPEVFRDGLYIPLEITGKYNDNVIAFARRHKRTWIITVVPISYARIESEGSPEMDWKDTAVKLPPEAPDKWEHALLKSEGKQEGEIKLNEIFQGLPMAVLTLQKPEKKRSAGVLLSITSLPSDYGIGDIGPESRNFADFLSRSGQKIWQILPVTITHIDAAHSPYSSYSGIAGNPLLISLEDLVKSNLLDTKDLKGKEVKNKGKVKFKKAGKLKTKMLEKAWMNFQAGRSQLHGSFEKFKSSEASWLDDFALFEIIRQKQQKPWYEWPNDLRKRNKPAMDKVKKQNAVEIEKVKFIQFLFFHQWQHFKAYCAVRDIRLMGDIPFYVGYDSVDVWAHPEIFAVDKNGRMTGMAGVPPDYFNSDGQLWHMPVFRWDVLERTGYAWWVERLRKNLELFDTVRLDHFRAFVDYWEVPGDAENARNGKWKNGPGLKFFEKVGKTLFGKEQKAWPFIAEDLGDISPEVYTLRDKLGIPGMKVLQFAFGDDLPESIHTPHNYSTHFVAYTGTHDNNTTRGWYRKDLKPADRRRINAYANKKVKEEDIASEMLNFVYLSVANTVVIPMQDILHLDEKSRMNTPATITKNWKWRMKSIKHDEVEIELRQITHLSNR